MAQMKDFFKSLIVFFSEHIWIYFMIVMFTGIEWNEPYFFDVTWWVIAGIAGYVINVVIARKAPISLLIMTNFLTLGLLIFQNWMLVVPNGSLVFGLAVSIAISFLFLRSASFIYWLPTRGNMLRRFEGNIIFYIIFAWYFTANNTVVLAFHPSFILAIILSLLGMILTLDNETETDPNENIDIHKVGESSWFTGVLMGFLIFIPLIAFVFLLPQVNRALNTLVISVWQGVKSLGSFVTSIILWLQQFFPVKDITEPLPEGGPGDSVEAPAETEEIVFTLPMSWIIGGIAVLAIILAIWIISKFLKNRRTIAGMEVKSITISKSSWWDQLKEKLVSFVRSMKVKWRKRFRYYYIQPVYWYYTQIQKWGKKNGLPQKKTETTKEYIKKLIDYIPKESLQFSHKESTLTASDVLHQLADDYQATYYGAKSEKETEVYQRLLKHLHRLPKINGNSKKKDGGRTET